MKLCRLFGWLVVLLCGLWPCQAIAVEEHTENKQPTNQPANQRASEPASDDVSRWPRVGLRCSVCFPLITF
uniref:Putative secreted protein n=1 Tax=Anopheles marajoara TaxID=58244 RepID=A0A2M4CEE9_9DIPT